MEISDGTVGIFYISKLLGLAPFSMKNKGKGKFDISRNLILSIYSFSLLSIMVFLTYRGLLFDANSKVPVRMKSATSKVVTALDVSVVVMASVAGMFCGLLGVTSTRNLNRRLQKIDDCLNSFGNVRKDRIITILLILIPIVSITILLGLDVWTWLRFADEIRFDYANADLNVEWYIPFYSLYYILTGLQIGFANTAFGLGRRYRRLNLMLRSSCLGESDDDLVKNIKFKPKITTVRTVSQSYLTLNANSTKASSSDCLYGEGSAEWKQTLNTELRRKRFAFKTDLLGGMEENAKKQNMLLQLLADHHESLGKCVSIVSRSYGIAVLFILISCLLHLVATAYFLFLEILTKKDNGYLWLQILWIIFHACRLLMVVEPCHLATNESKKSIKIICEIQRKNHDPIFDEAIKKFWQQLLVDDSEFTAMSLCKVNRKILTSFSSAIATYLVILIQFQKTNG